MRATIPATALEQHIAVLGKTGSGKTSTAKLLVEQVAVESRVCVLDTVKSDWWGLTSSADGKHPGLPFHILGGPRGHVPLPSSAGKAVAEIVASGALRHSIIDMADFEAGGIQSFFVDFAPALLRNMKGVLYLVMEEAHELAPKERSGIGAETMAIHWAKKIATAGRSRGIRLVVLSQRTQALHNALLGSCETLIAHRFTTPADQTPVVAWLKSNLAPERAREVAASLSSLKTGEGWICSGEAGLLERRQFPRIHTYDNSATPTDDDHQHAVKTAPVDQDKLRAIIGEAVKEAEENDPKQLRARIADLQKQVINGSPSAEPDPSLLEEAETRGHALGHEAGYSAAIRAIQPITDRLETLAAAVNETISGFREDLQRIASKAPAADYPRSTPAIRAETAAAPRERPVASSALPKGETAVLTAIAQHRDGVTREQLTVLTGYKRSTRDAYIQRLRERALIEDGTTIRVTAAGTAALGDAFKPLPTGKALLDHWMQRLPEGERRVLDIVVRGWPQRVDREVISKETGYARSSRDAYLQRLGARHLVITERGHVRASDTLFASRR